MRFQCPTPFLTLAITPLRSASIAIWQALRTAPYRHDRTVTIMDTTNLDKLKVYRDMGVERTTVGVSIDTWDEPDQVMPMIDRFAEIIPALQS